MGRALRLSENAQADFSAWLRQYGKEIAALAEANGRHPAAFASTERGQGSASYTFDCPFADKLFHATIDISTIDK